jgi:hypothetical protein
MGTTTIRRSNNFNFEYSIVTSHSFPQDERTKSGVPLAGASSVAGKNLFVCKSSSVPSTAMPGESRLRAKFVWGDRPSDGEARGRVSPENGPAVWQK